LKSNFGLSAELNHICLHKLKPMKNLLIFVSLVLISMAANAQVSSSNLIIQGSVTSTISTFPISNWPVTITGMGMTSTVYTDVNGFYSDTISNGSVIGPNQLFIVQTFDCDSSSITNTVSNNQGTVDFANLDFQICAQNLPCNADFSNSGPLLTNNSYQFIGLANSDNAHHLWTFGDGASTEQEYPFHAYDTIGVYNVCHIVSIDGVCADTICITIQATENPACTAEIVTGYATNGWPMFSAIGGSEIATYTWILSPYDSNGQGYGGSFFFSTF
jgi:PKD repeat protein